MRKVEAEVHRFLATRLTVLFATGFGVFCFFARAALAYAPVQSDRIGVHRTHDGEEHDKRSDETNTPKTLEME
jgi:hypothetical protein